MATQKLMVAGLQSGCSVDKIRTYCSLWKDKSWYEEGNVIGSWTYDAAIVAPVDERQARRRVIWQLFWRTITKLGQFFKLAVTADSLSVDLVLDTLVKYMVLEGCSDDLKEHFLEKTLSSLTCEEFQDIGSPFQEAQGRTQRSGRQLFTSLSSEESSTMNAWKISAEDTVAKLEKMSVKNRRTFVLENRFCLNCFLPGQRGSVCRSLKRCTKCKLKHHSLLHEEH